MKLKEQIQLWKAMKRYTREWERRETYGVKTIEFTNGVMDGQFMEAPGDLEEHSVTHMNKEVVYEIKKREDGKVVAKLKEIGG